MSLFDQRPKSEMSILVDESYLSKDFAEKMFVNLEPKVEAHAKKYRHLSEFSYPPSRPKHWAKGYLEYVWFVSFIKDLWESGKITLVTGYKTHKFQMFIPAPFVEFYPDPKVEKHKPAFGGKKNRRAPRMSPREKRKLKEAQGE